MTEEELFANHFELVYADIATFGKAPPARYVGLEGADVAIFGIPWDGRWHVYSATRRQARSPRHS